MASYVLRALASLKAIWFSSVYSVVSDSLRPHGLQYTRLPSPPPSPEACYNSCPSSHDCFAPHFLKEKKKHRLKRNKKRERKWSNGRREDKEGERKKKFYEFKGETMAEKSDSDHLVQPGGEPPTVTSSLRSVSRSWSTCLHKWIQVSSPYTILSMRRNVEKSKWNGCLRVSGVL